MLIAWVGYVVLGIINTILLAWTMRDRATPTAFAVWMALSLVFMKSVDVFWPKGNWSWTELFFIGLIIVGVVGLKLRP